jgi:hypothetical protein
MAKKKVQKSKTKSKTKTKSRPTSEKMSREQVTGLLKNLRRIFGSKGKKK